jgi:cellulose synthase/poly-beta-1,6-N-acetylglucosamine synthase-like glycosyltransferase
MINVLVFVSFFVATLSIVAWLFIFLHPAKPWDFQPVGDDAPPPPLPDGTTFPRVAIIVPARNEAESLPRTLPGLLRQDYPGEYIVYVVDDRSTDGTATVALKIQHELKAANMCCLTNSPKPDDWMGKVWAVNRGVTEAALKPAEFFLLTDADIFHEPGSLKRLVA